MSRNENARFEFESIVIDSASAETKYRQIENQIRDAIHQKTLVAGSLVPSTRTLAELLGVSRNSILAAYDQLRSEGYLKTTPGSGTRVSKLESDSVDETIINRKRTPSRNVSLSQTGRFIAQNVDWLPEQSATATPFRPHLPDLGEFPNATWNRLSNEQSRWTTSHLDLCDPQGYEPLREQIAEYMAVSRGVTCSKDEVIVTTGAQQSLHLTTQVLLDRGARLWMEEPGNTPAIQLLQAMGHDVVSISLDHEGMDVNRGQTIGKPPKLIYVTPACQWPMGTTMSLNRRMQLLSYATKHESWILEDDYNGEFRYAGRPQRPLSLLDERGMTIYMGSFSKYLFPALRLAFMIVPSQLAPVFRQARWLLDRYSSSLPQRVLHRFIESGEFLKHVRRMRMLYRERQQFLYDLLKKSFGKIANITLPECGMHLVIKGKTAVLDRRLVATARQACIEFHPVEIYSQSETAARGLVLGFAAFNERKMKTAIARWKKLN